MRLPGSINEVLALTRAGRLDEATALVQRQLFGAPAPGEHEARSKERTAPKVPLPPFAAAPGNAAKARKPRNTAAPAGAKSMRSERHEGRDGRIDYRLFVPSALAAPAPLVVMLHGCTQSPEDFARGTRMNELAAELAFIVAYPEQTQSANPQKCWNWFRPGDQERGRGEPALLAAMTDEIASRHQVDRARIYVAGLSAGGAAAAIMASAYPDIYAAVGIHSGLACGSASDLASALAAMRGSNGKAAAPRPGPFVPTITFHGDRDRTVHPSNSEAILATGVADPRLAGFDRRISEGRSPGGRDFRRTALVDDGGRNWLEHWEIGGGGHAWSGGDAAGSYADPAGPDASRAMLEFFLGHRLTDGAGEPAEQAAAS